MVKVHGPNVIQMADQGEDTPSQFVIPHLDLVIVTTRDEERLRAMKIHATNRALVLIEAIDESPHSIVPQLDGAIVETRQDPWASWMECQPLDAVALRLEFSQHGGYQRMMRVRAKVGDIAGLREDAITPQTLVSNDLSEPCGRSSRTRKLGTEPSGRAAPMRDMWYPQWSPALGYAACGAVVTGEARRERGEWFGYGSLEGFIGELERREASVVTSLTYGLTPWPILMSWGHCPKNQQSPKSADFFGKCAPRSVD